MITAKNQQKRSLIAVLLTFALSSLSATIVFPIFAPLFLGSDHAIVKEAIPESMRAIILGLFLASFPLAQFLFSPLLGEYADHKGRKKAYLITLLVEVIGYVVAAIAIKHHHLSLLFFGRFITGIAAGNMSVCLATLVDISHDEKTKLRYFSYGSALVGVTFVLGPFLGGRLSDATLSPIFSLAFPMWVGAFLAFINLLVMFFLFKETLKVTKDEPYHPMIALQNVQLAFQSKAVRGLYFIYFFFLFAWNMLFQFLPALMVDEFKASPTFIGDISAFLGLVWIVASLFMSKIMHTKLPVKRILKVFLVLFALLSLIVSLHLGKLAFFLVASLGVFFAGGMWPIFTGAISNAAEESMQGKVLGLSQSIQSLSMMLAPLLGGFFLEAYEKVPFAVAALSSLIGATLLIKAKGHHFQM